MGLLDSVVQLAGTFLGGQQNQSPLLKMAVQLLNQNGGINGLVQSFQQKGLGEVVNSWVSTGQNQPVSGDQLQSVLGNTINQFASKLNMSSGDVSSQLSQLLPQLIDKVTPEGRVPDHSSLESTLAGLLKQLG